MIDKFLANIFHFCTHFCKILQTFKKERAKESAKRREPTLNEGKFVLNVYFIIALKPDGLCVYETTKQDSI
jgi:hypothetical protein